jgi:hypothetical protein
MSSPLGMWNVVTNLYNSVLNITSVDEQGRVTGTIQMEPAPAAPYEVAGTWNAANNEVNFSYTIPLENAPSADAALQASSPEVVEHSRVETIVRPPIWAFNTVQLSGYIFQAGKPLFNAAPGPTSAAWNMMAGTASGPGGVSAWVARSQQQLS